MMKNDVKKPAKTVAEPKLTPVEWRYAAFLALWTTYLHLRAWGLPDYEELTPTDQEGFRALVKKGRDALFAHVEDCKRAVLRGGLGSQVRDEWLAVIGMQDFDLVKGFPEAKRNRLGRILDEMYPLLVRLDPDAQHESAGADHHLASESATSGRGVSMLDAALLRNENDLEAARSTVDRWQKTRVHKPEPIGTDPSHRQVKLYRVDDLAGYIRQCEGAPLTPAQMSELKKKARPPRS